MKKLLMLCVLFCSVNAGAFDKSEYDYGFLSENHTLIRYLCSGEDSIHKYGFEKDGIQDYGVFKIKDIKSNIEAKYIGLDIPCKNDYNSDRLENTTFYYVHDSGTKNYRIEKDQIYEIDLDLPSISTYINSGQEITKIKATDDGFYYGGHIFSSGSLTFSTINFNKYTVPTTKGWTYTFKFDAKSGKLIRYVPTKSTNIYTSSTFMQYVITLIPETGKHISGYFDIVSGEFVEIDKNMRIKNEK